MIRTTVGNQDTTSVTEEAFAFLSGRRNVSADPSDRNTDWLAVAQSAFQNELIVPANSGDHPMVHRFLKSVIQSPSDSEFEHTLDRPEYAANQRLLVRHHGEIIGHLRMTPQHLRFRNSQLDNIDLNEFAILPEFNSDACRRIMLAAVRQTAAGVGADLVTMADTQIDLSKIVGWTEVGSGANRVVSPRDLVAEVEAYETISGVTAWQKKYHERPWRYVETDIVAGIYERAMQGQSGSAIRSEDYWRWMLGRRGFDRAFVALDREATAGERVVAYVFVRNNRVVELATEPGHEEAKLSLLRRVALDAVERGNNSVAIPALAITQGLHRMEPSSSVDLRNVTLYGRVVAPQQFLKRVACDVSTQAQERGVAVGTKLGIVTDSELFSITIQKRGLKIVAGEKCRSRITLSSSMMSRLLLGSCDVEEATKAGRLTASTRIVIGIADRMFPKQDFIRTTLDDQPAMD